MAAVNVGLTLWSFRKPLLVLAGVMLGLPLALIVLVAGSFTPLAAAGGELQDPLPHSVLTQPFGCTPLDIEPWAMACPTHHFHSGIDLAAAAGSSVFSATSGVAKVGRDPGGYGSYIVVRRDEGLSTLYGHLSAVLVESGDAVAASEEIGQVGTTGNSTGPHLHFEIRLHGEPVDPLPMLGRRSLSGGDATPGR